MELDEHNEAGARRRGENRHHRCALMARSYSEGHDNTFQSSAEPLVSSGGHCFIWVELAVSFVRAAALYGKKAILREQRPDVRGLKEFRFNVKTAVNDSDALDIVFGNTGLDTYEEMRDALTDGLK